MTPWQRLCAFPGAREAYDDLSRARCSFPYPSPSSARGKLWERQIAVCASRLMVETAALRHECPATFAVLCYELRVVAIAMRAWRLSYAPIARAAA